MAPSAKPSGGKTTNPYDPTNYLKEKMVAEVMYPSYHLQQEIIKLLKGKKAGKDGYIFIGKGDLKGDTLQGVVEFVIGKFKDKAKNQPPPLLDGFFLDAKAWNGFIAGTNSFLEFVGVDKKLGKTKFPTGLGLLIKPDTSSVGFAVGKSF